MVSSVRLQFYAAPQKKISEKCSSFQVFSHLSQEMVNEINHHYASGSVNINREPLPGSLSIDILPPCFSTIPLQSCNPNTVPHSSAVPFFDIFKPVLNNL